MKTRQMSAIKINHSVEVFLCLVNWEIEAIAHTTSYGLSHWKIIEHQQTINYPSLL